MKGLCKVFSSLPDMFYLLIFGSFTQGELRFWRGLGRGVLEFLGDEEAGDLRPGAVLPDEVYLL